jgi:hypothetical protein
MHPKQCIRRHVPRGKPAMIEWARSNSTRRYPSSCVDVASASVPGTAARSVQELAPPLQKRGPLFPISPTTGTENARAISRAAKTQHSASFTPARCTAQRAPKSPAVDHTRGWLTRRYRTVLCFASVQGAAGRAAGRCKTLLDHHSLTAVGLTCCHRDGPGSGTRQRKSVRGEWCIRQTRRLILWRSATPVP